MCQFLFIILHWIVQSNNNEGINYLSRGGIDYS